MTQKQFEKYIEKLNIRGSVLGLDSIRELLSRMDNPQKKLKFVHIAGTNGKGSVLAFTSTILKSAGYTVGRYISPVIYDYREKIQVNEKYISKHDLYEGMEYISSITDKMEEEGMTLPTLFEVETALAFWYFDKKSCDVVVLETGLGGKDDATNVIDTTLVSSFAKISMDHMQILGKSIKEIAAVKSGTIKERTIVISNKQEKEAKDVLVCKAKEKNCSFTQIEEAKNVKLGLKTQTFDYKEYKKIKINLHGVWQIENACVAIENVLALKELGYDISEKAIYDGLFNTKWPARFDIINSKPMIIMDGAHNEDASVRLRESIVTYLNGKELVFVVGVLGDKEYEKVMANTLDLAKYVITLTPPDNNRALDGMELARCAEKYSSNVTCADSVEEAVEMASLLAGKECVIIAFGSLSYLGRFEKAVLSYFNKKKK